MKNVLITGIAGFIGSNLSVYLSDKGYNINGMDNLSFGILSNISKDINVSFSDIQFYENCLKATKDIDIVIHLAAISGVQNSFEQPIKSTSINVMGTINMLQASVENDVKKFIYASSGSVCGDQTPPFNEQMPIKPKNIYGSSKASCEHYVNAYKESFGLDTTIVRFSNVYGPNSLHKPKNLIPAFILSCLNPKRKFEIFGDGNQTRDFIYIDDLINAIYKILRNDCSGETYQIATGEETSLNKLIEIMNQTLFEITGKKLDIKYGPELLGDVKRNYAVIEKAKFHLNWIPEYSIQSGIKKLFSFYL